jgi:hypothetical protein
MRRASIVAVFVLVVCTAQAMAAGGEFTLFGGYQDPGPLNMYRAGTPFQFHGSGMYGIRGEATGLKYFGYEQTVAYTTRLFNNVAIGKGMGGDVRGLLYSSNFTVTIPVKVKYIPHFAPFLTMGVGFMMPTGTSADTINLTMMGDYGLGVKMNRLKGPFGLRFDVRNWRSKEIKRYGRGYGGIAILEASGGITYTLGKEK